MYNLNPFSSAGTLSANGLLMSSNPAAGTEFPVGAVVLSAPGVLAANGTGLWLDWHQFVVRRLQTSILPAAPTQLVGNPLALTHQVNVALLPASVTYRWDFGDSTAKVTVSNNPNVGHTYTTPGTYTVTAEILDDRNTQVIARSTATATITADVAWQFTSVGQYTFTPPAGGIGSAPTDTVNLRLYAAAFAQIQSTPGNAFFYLHTVGSCQTLLLLYFTQSVPVPYVPTASDLSNDAYGLYGATCPIQSPFTASLSIGALGSGALTGSSTAPPAQLGGGMINAAMTGATLSGTFTWRGFFSGGDGIYSIPFTAAQVLPKP